jgi:hypothetical protein
MEVDVGSERDDCDGSQLHSTRISDDLSVGKLSSTCEMNDELSKLSESEEIDFVNDALDGLNPRHTDMWNSWVNDWVSDKPTLQRLQQTSDRDPIFHLMREKAKESHSLSQALQQQQQQQQQQQPNQSTPYEETRFPPAGSADQNPPCTTLYVGNLPVDVDEEELKAMFAKQRGYERLSFRTKEEKPVCFVEFEDASSATRAMHDLYGHELHNSTKGGIRLSFSTNALGVRSSQPSWHNHQPENPPISQATSSRDLFLSSIAQQALEHEVPNTTAPSTTEGNNADSSLITLDIDAFNFEDFDVSREIGDDVNSIGRQYLMAANSSNNASVSSSSFDPSSDMDNDG